MPNTNERKELLSVLYKHDAVFNRCLKERIHARGWMVSPEYSKPTIDNGKIIINIGSVEAIQRIAAESAIAGVLSFIDILSNTNPSNNPDELQFLKRRIDRIESELIKILPPDFTNPSTENPNEN